MKTEFSRRFPLSRVLAVVALLGGPLAPAAFSQDTVEPTATLTTLPGGILPESPLAQVIKLAQAGVDEGIIQAYITNSTSTFNLNSDKLIYLKDAGVPNSLASAMMQHDVGLQAQIAAATPPPIPPPVVPEPAPAPAASPAPVTDSTPPEVVVSPPAPVTVNYFYDTLSPYGNWVMVNGYGRCWQPGVAIYNHDWQPYGDHGHWVYTDSGWYWVSDYSWGWAPFHYGRWFRDARFGWCWYPDTVWGPSWVTWRYSDDYYGWAPLPPGAAYHEGAGFFYNGSSVAVGFDFGLAPDCFVFVGANFFCDPHPYRHRLDRGGVYGIYHRTVGINHFDRDDHHGFINHGIDPGRISRATHEEIRPITIHDTDHPVGRFAHGEAVNHGEVMVNRPQFQDNRGNVVVDRPHNADWGRNRPAQFNQPHAETFPGDRNNRLTPPKNPGGYHVVAPQPEVNQPPAHTYEPPQSQWPADNRINTFRATPHSENNFASPVRPERPSAPVPAPPALREPTHQSFPQPVTSHEPAHMAPQVPQQLAPPPRYEPPQRPEPPHYPAPQPIAPPRQVEPPQRFEPKPQPQPEPRSQPAPAPAPRANNDNPPKHGPH